MCLALSLAAGVHVLQQTSLLLGSVYNKSMSVRIGLLAPDHESMLLMLPGPQTGKSTVKEGNSGDRPAHYNKDADRGQLWSCVGQLYELLRHLAGPLTCRTTAFAQHSESA
jgi:hypothetical protein